MRDGSKFYSENIEHLSVVVGETCDEGQVQIVFDVDVEVTLEVHVEHDGNYASYSDVDIDDIKIIKVHDITICENEIDRTSHAGLQRWLERDFESSSTSDSYLINAVEEHGVDHNGMDLVEEDHPDI